MKKFNKALYKTIPILIVCSMFTCACSNDANNPLDLLQTASNQYDEGKEVVDYELPGSSAEMLNKLIDEYSARRGMPEPMKEEDAQGIAEGTDEDNQLDTTGNDRIGSDDDLEKMLSWMLDETKVVANYTPVNGYSVKRSNYEKSLERAMRKDSIDGICVSSYGMYIVGTTGTLVLEYELPVEELIRIKDETRDLVKDALNHLKLNGKSELEIITTVNDYLCDNNEYPDADIQKYPGNLEGYSPLSHTAYELFKEHDAVCEGYSRACELLLSEYGIECINIWGDTTGGGHAWNMVKVGDAWYHLDTCWNDGSSTRRDFFLLSDDDMSQTRTWDTAEYPISAKTKYQP